MALGTADRLGRVMHSVEDSFAGGHGCSEAPGSPWNPLNWPEWIDHGWDDYSPSGEATEGAFEADIELIRQWKELMRKKGKDDTCQ